MHNNLIPKEELVSLEMPIERALPSMLTYHEWIKSSIVQCKQFATLKSTY